ncbi:MAG: acyl-CoA thioesterase [Treponema sp.]|nr:acyl-CoA thioesterase [Treponema sp.]
MKAFVRKVNYYETDKMGITHHSNYIRFMEEARIDFLSNIGWGFDKLEDAGLVSPVLSITCDYKQSTTFADELKIIVNTEKFSGLKFVINYTMKCGDKVVCTASSTHVFMDKNGRPVFLEKQYPDFYKALTETKVEE